MLSLKALEYASDDLFNVETLACIEDREQLYLKSLRAISYIRKYVSCCSLMWQLHRHWGEQKGAP